MIAVPVLLYARAACALWVGLPALHWPLPPDYSAEQLAPPRRARRKNWRRRARQGGKADAVNADQLDKLVPDLLLWAVNNFFDDPEFGTPAIEQARQLERPLSTGLGFPLIRHDALGRQSTPASARPRACSCRTPGSIGPPPNRFPGREGFFERYERACIG